MNFAQKSEPVFFQITVAGKLVAEANVYCVPHRIKRMLPNADEDSMHLHRLWVAKRFRRNGYGSVIMNSVIQWADLNGMLLTLRVRPFEPNGCPVRKLVEFYQRFGFMLTPGVGRDVMVRV